MHSLCAQVAKLQSNNAENFCSNLYFLNTDMNFQNIVFNAMNMHENRIWISLHVYKHLIARDCILSLVSWYYGRRLVES